MRELRGVFVLAVLALLAGGLPPTAWGAPYWVAYEGDVFPEEDGWTRRVIDTSGHEPPGAERSLNDGIFTIDSSRSQLFSDFYQIDRPLNPDESAGEMFIAEWSVRVREFTTINGSSDCTLVIAADQMATLTFRFAPAAVTSSREGWSIVIDPNESHAYQLCSFDMVNYDLWIDGHFARRGQWDPVSLNQSFFNFGDGARNGGMTSISDWDYVRFGVVPEPSTVVLLLLGILSTLGRELWLEQQS